MCDVTLAYEERLRAEAHCIVHSMENPVCQHHKFGHCKFKQQCLKEHVKNECEDLSACREIKSCKKRHPKICRRFALENFCKFGKECSYVHNTKEHSKICKDVHDDILEDMKNLKAEVDLIKKTVQSLSEIKKEGKIIKKSIEALKKDINDIKAENIKISKKVSTIEEDMESETDENSDADEIESHDETEIRELLSCIYCKTHFGKRKYYESHMENHEGDGIIKCLKCLYSCESKVTLIKHMNTKHPHSSSKNSETVTEEEDFENYCDIEDDSQLYCIEMVNDEPVWACNLCSEGLDSEEEMIIHMKECHERIVSITEEPVSVCKDGKCAESGRASCIECIYKQWDY